MNRAQGATAVNPFSTSRVRPGAMDYLFPPGENLAILVERLAANGWRGQITGAHGTGKSTLLACLIPALRAAGRRPLPAVLRDGMRRLPEEISAAADVDQRAIFVVDGYEQLGPAARRKLARWCRRDGCGLLVTAHASVGLPPLFHAAADPRRVRLLVERLLSGYDERIEADLIERCLLAHRGNVRETFFALYDHFERRNANVTRG